jgi:hypothetical protein
MPFDVEEVLAKLTASEKSSLLSGIFTVKLVYMKDPADKFQELISGTHFRSQNIMSHPFV